MTKPDQRQQIVGYAVELASKIVCRVKHRSALAKMESEDIEQELLAYVLEHADRYNPAKGSIEAFTDGKDRIYVDQRHHLTRISPKAQYVQDILAGIVQAVGGDHATDLTRLLRLGSR